MCNPESEEISFKAWLYKFFKDLGVTSKSLAPEG
jgi:hypothetical protein